MTDPITADLVNALRYQIRYHPEHTVDMCRNALEAFDAAKDAPDARDAEIAALKHDLERTRDERNRARLEEEKRWKAAQPDLQRLHDLVKQKVDHYDSCMEGADHDDLMQAEGAAGAMRQLLRDIAKLQSAGAVKS